VDALDFDHEPGAVMKVKEWRDIPTWPTWEGTTAARPVRRIGFCWRAEENMSPLRVKSLPVSVAGKIGLALFEYEVLSLSPEKADLYSTERFFARVPSFTNPTA